MVVVAGSALRRGNIEEEVVDLWTTVNASGQFCGVAEMAGDTADTAQLPNGFSIVFMCVLKTTLYSVSNSSLDIVLR
ncbi:unnamed protein product [Sphagnum jensenii]|uniref:Uncharacterized protein n=1 Tax=Sphagnum jensenii TaxID=128206 RepID=A0ABP0XI03_9BRYO